MTRGQPRRIGAIVTVANQSIRNDYTGSGSTGPFGFSFPLQSISDLKVIQTDLSGVDTTLILTTDYTVVGIKAPTDYSSGGNVTLTNALTSGFHLALVANENGTQNTSIKNNSQYYASLHENQFDYRAITDLQLLEKVNKAIIAPDSEPAGTTNLTLPNVTQRASKALGFDSLGNVAMIQQVPPGSVAFTGTGITVAQAATLTALLNLLGIFVVADQASLAGLTPVASGFNLAYQQDLGNMWLYNSVAAAWQQIGLATP